jgi:flagellar biosynthesis component FlhA
MKGFNLNDLQNMDVNQLTNAMQRSVTIMKWLGVAVGIIGLMTIMYHNIYIGIGAWLMIWGNNLEQKGRARQNELKKTELQKQAMSMFGNIFGQQPQNPKDN